MRFTTALLGFTLASASLWAAAPRYGVDYRLIQLTRDGQDLALPSDRPITLRWLDSRTLGGRAPVNLYFGAYTLDDAGRIHWGRPGFASTMMAGAPELMQLEQVYLQALASTATLAVDANRLSLQSPDGSLKLVFEEQQAAQAFQDLLDHPLQLTRLIVDGQPLPLPDGMPILLLLAQDGRATGFSGVNRYSGHYRFSPDDRLTFSAMATTRMAGPAPLMQLETAYLKALSTVTTARASGSELTLENPDKTVVLEFAAR